MSSLSQTQSYDDNRLLVCPTVQDFMADLMQRASTKLLGTAESTSTTHSHPTTPSTGNSSLHFSNTLALQSPINARVESHTECDDYRSPVIASTVDVGNDTTVGCSARKSALAARKRISKYFQNENGASGDDEQEIRGADVSRCLAGELEGGERTPKNGGKNVKKSSGGIVRLKGTSTEDEISFVNELKDIVKVAIGSCDEEQLEVAKRSLKRLPKEQLVRLVMHMLVLLANF